MQYSSHPHKTSIYFFIKKEINIPFSSQIRHLLDKLFQLYITLSGFMIHYMSSYWGCIYYNKNDIFMLRKEKETIFNLVLTFNHKLLKTEITLNLIPMRFPFI